MKTGKTKTKKNIFLWGIIFTGFLLANLNYAYAWMPNSLGNPELLQETNQLARMQQVMVDLGYFRVIEIKNHHIQLGDKQLEVIEAYKRGEDGKLHHVLISSLNDDCRNPSRLVQAVLANEDLRNLITGARGNNEIKFWLEVASALVASSDEALMAEYGSKPIPKLYRDILTQNGKPAPDYILNENRLPRGAILVAVADLGVVDEDVINLDDTEVETDYNFPPIIITGNREPLPENKGGLRQRHPGPTPNILIEEIALTDWNVEAQTYTVEVGFKSQALVFSNLKASEIPEFVEFAEVYLDYLNNKQNYIQRGREMLGDKTDFTNAKIEGIIGLVDHLNQTGNEFFASRKENLLSILEGSSVHDGDYTVGQFYTSVDQTDKVFAVFEGEIQLVFTGDDGQQKKVSVSREYVVGLLALCDISGRAAYQNDNFFTQDAGRIAEGLFERAKDGDYASLSELSELYHDPDTQYLERPGGQASGAADGSFRVDGSGATEDRWQIDLENIGFDGIALYRVEARSAGDANHLDVAIEADAQSNIPAGANAEEGDYLGKAVLTASGALNGHEIVTKINGLRITEQGFTFEAFQRETQGYVDNDYFWVNAQVDRSTNPENFTGHATGEYNVGHISRVFDVSVNADSGAIEEVKEFLRDNLPDIDEETAIQIAEDAYSNIAALVERKWESGANITSEDIYNCIVNAIVDNTDYTRSEVGDMASDLRQFADAMFERIVTTNYVETPRDSRTLLDDKRDIGIVLGKAFSGELEIHAVGIEVDGRVQVGFTVAEGGVKVGPMQVVAAPTITLPKPDMSFTAFLENAHLTGAVIGWNRSENIGDLSQSLLASSQGKFSSSQLATYSRYLRDYIDEAKNPSFGWSGFVGYLGRPAEGDYGVSGDRMLSQGLAKDAYIATLIYGKSAGLNKETKEGLTTFLSFCLNDELDFSVPHADIIAQVEQRLENLNREITLKDVKQAFSEALVNLGLEGHEAELFESEAFSPMANLIIKDINTLVYFGVSFINRDNSNSLQFNAGSSKAFGSLLLSTNPRDNFNFSAGFGVKFSDTTIRFGLNKEGKGQIDAARSFDNGTVLSGTATPGLYMLRLGIPLNP
ncbi:MAG: hypothetical protein JW734_03100 [Candidatus Omnitrophica bacterium]|nr:hypothetical protein [Candidatus Omnitrophota bacterium]